MAGTCRTPDCQNPAFCRGWCIKCYSHRKNCGLLDSGPKCVAPDCKKPGDWTRDSTFPPFCRQHFEMFIAHTRANGSLSHASEREAELLPNPPPPREKFVYEGDEQSLIAEQEARDAEK